MRNYFGTLPARLALSRLLAIPVLWVFALLKLETALATGLLLALITDLLDGYAARRLNQNSEFLSRLDALVDQVLALSIVLWLLLLRPEIFRQHQLLSLVTLALGLICWIVGWLKFGRPAALHLYSGRIAGAVAVAFVLHAFFMGRYSTPLFYGAALLSCLAAAEEIAILLRHEYVDGSIRSILPFSGGNREQGTGNRR